MLLHLRRNEPPDALPACHLLADSARRNIQGREGGAEQLPPPRQEIAFPVPTIAMRFFFFNTQPFRRRRLARGSRAGKQDEIARREKLPVPVPGGDLREGGGPHHEEPVDPGLGPA